MTGPGPPPYPRATYRLQLNERFGFEDARGIVPYLARLGISHIYVSPILMARPGSTHGYDIVDHNRLNPEIGDEAAFDALIEALHAHGMGIVLDFVPNHMFIGPENRWWTDILEWGRASPFASYVDIDWEPLEPTNSGKVLLPVLGDHYGQVLERGELVLAFDGERGGFAVRYFDNAFPISPRDYPSLLERAAAVGGGAADALAVLTRDFSEALRWRTSRAQRRARHERTAALRAEFAALAAGDPRVREALVQLLSGLNGEAGRAGTFDALHRLLERQSYRLAFWRVAAHEINYRRFFDINELVGLRMEQPELFELSHRLVGRYIAQGKIQGLRLDHVDGLRDPKGYLDRLQTLARRADGTVDGEGPRQPLYAVVEKILAPGERLPGDWAACGTTGYEFIASTGGLFVDPAGEGPLTRAYEAFLGRSADFREIVDAAKRLIMRETMASELNVLASAFNRLAKRSRRTRDYTLTGFREALEDVVANFPVYRSYVTARGAAAEDRRVIEAAVRAAKRAARTPDTSIYDFIRDVLTLDLIARGREAYPRAAALDTALKFQQYTGPVMAKAMEDTAFYRYLRFTALNEVGGEPERWGVTPEDFHAANRERVERLPFTLVATATHDHKRGEDVRARLAVLSEIPELWAARVTRWAELNAGAKVRVEGREAPGRNDEYLLYQTLVGAWPLELAGPNFEGLEGFRARIKAYMLKAVREAKVHTSWAAPDEAYEAALGGFVEAALDPRRGRLFLEDISAFADRIAPAGAVNGLAQTLLKLTVPGVPDFYQGTERWDLSLVDPDNRHSVDYRLRAAGPLSGAAELCRTWRDGRIKQHVIAAALALRCRDPSLFAAGAYRPLSPEGPGAEHLVAFARRHEASAAVVAVPRLVGRRLVGASSLSAEGGWEGVRLRLEGLDAGPWRELLSGRELVAAGDGSLECAQLFGSLPLALLHRTR